MSDLVPKFLDPLEELLAESLIMQTPAKKRRRATHLGPDLRAIEGRLREQFAFPSAHWARTRCVALMHLETNELIGNFVEYVHVEVRNCRRLVHEPALVSVEGCEYVSGPQWIAWPAELAELEREPVETREAVVDLHLDELGLRAFGVTVLCTIRYGGIARVELYDATHFHSDDRTHAMFLPKHLNVLSGLSLDTKLNIREQVLTITEEERDDNATGTSLDSASDLRSE